jgi:2-polyprenyl-6-methoxyphenol hydroxylase-like FAD-dependent oxidoreductase
MQLGSAYAKGIDFWCRDRRCPTSAYWLAKAGFDVTVAEQARGMRSSGSPVDVRGPAVEVAERMGVMAQIREASTQVRDMVFVNARGRVMSRVDMRAWGEPGDVELPRGDLAAILRAAVPDEVEFEFGNTVTALDQDADGVTAEFTSGPARRFDVVIGADGAHSGVRALSFGPEAEFVKHLGVYVATLPLDGETGTDLVMYNTPGRAVAIHPAGGHPGAAFMFRAPQIPQFDHRDLDQHKRLLCDAYAGRGGVCPNCLTGCGPPMTCTSTRSAGSRCRLGLAVGSALSVTPHRVSRCSGTAPAWR